MKTIIDSIQCQVSLIDANGLPLSKIAANALSDGKMKEIEEKLITKLGNKSYTSIEVESGVEGDDKEQLKRTIVATAYLEGRVENSNI